MKPTGEGTRLLQGAVLTAVTAAGLATGALGCCPRGVAAGGEALGTPAPAESSPAAEPTARAIHKMTPLLTVEAIEPCLDLWVDRLGFTKTIEVPGADGALGFVGLARDGTELMLQTRASVEADVPAAAPHFQGGVLYIEVEDIDWVVERLGGAEVLVPPRTTDYGMREVFVLEPCGHVLGFAAPAPPASSP